MSMVTVRLFAHYADLVGSTTLDVPLSHGDTVDDLLRNIRSHPAAAALPDNTRVAVNRSFACPGTVVQSGDEVALIPPVAGG